MKSKKKILFCVAGFYRNDIPGGIGIVFKLLNDDLRKGFSSTTNIYEKTWAKSNSKQKEALVKLYFDQLQEYGTFDESSKTASLDFLMVVNIWFLERYGYLKSDEYNGCILSYTDNLPDGW